MTVACLGWGSLVGNPAGLPVARGWFEDGPILPIEFARVSSGDRVTLVLLEGVRPVRSLWCLMSSSNPQQAQEALAEREGIEPENVDRSIGLWTPNERRGRVGVEIIATWGERLALDAVAWTDLQPGPRGERGSSHALTEEDVVRHLRGLDPSARRHAEEYVRRAPRQIDTDIRRRLELEFGWTPLPERAGE